MAEDPWFGVQAAGWLITIILLVAITCVLGWTLFTMFWTVKEWICSAIAPIRRNIQHRNWRRSMGLSWWRKDREAEKEVDIDPSYMKRPGDAV